MKKIFHYDYFSLGGVAIKDWSDSFFWPLEREATTRLTTDIYNKLGEMCDRHGQSFKGDCALIAYQIPNPILSLLNHSVVVERLRQKDFEIVHSDKLEFVPYILAGGAPSSPMAGFVPSLYPDTIMDKLRTQVRLLRKWRREIAFNRERDMDMSGFMSRKTRSAIAFEAHNVLDRPYTRQLPGWVALTTNAEWLSGGLPILEKHQADDLNELAEEYYEFVKDYAKSNFNLAFPEKILSDLLDYLRRHLTLIGKVYAKVAKEVEKHPPKRLFTPTGSKTLTRAISLATRHNGGRVSGFPHGYYIGHHKGARKALHEFATVDEFVAYTKGSSELLKEYLKLHPLPRGHKPEFPFDNTPDLLNQWKRFEATPLPDKIRTVMVLELSLIPEWAGYYAAESMVNFHFYYRICELMGKSGYNVIFKRRPKDMHWQGIDIFAGLPNVRVMSDPILFSSPEMLEMADAFIIQYGMSSTLFQAMCTNKTVIYADAGWEDWFPEPRRLMEKRCAVLKCGYDERNRAVFSEQELLDILAEKPSAPNTEFMEKYLFPEER